MSGKGKFANQLKMSNPGQGEYWIGWNQASIAYHHIGVVRGK
jgi:hypothetical protein